MALKAVHVSDVPHFDQVPEAWNPTFFAGGVDSRRNAFFPSKFLVIGHRGNGMNNFASSDLRFKYMKENSVLSFNAAGNLGVDYIEFDVQVTRDECPVIFHDNQIVSLETDTIVEQRVTDLTLSEFRSYGPQTDANSEGKVLMRRTKAGKIVRWEVDSDDPFCTLREAFERVNPSLGFNIELKFDDHIAYRDDYLIGVLQAILRNVFECAGERPIIFSTFQPDAALLLGKLQSTYPVFFLTNGGTETYGDARRNSLEEAVKLCLQGGLQGIVSEVKALFANPPAVSVIKEAKLLLLTYGKLNNAPEVVYMQHMMGVNGVIVDFVREISAAVSAYLKPVEEEVEREEEKGVVGTWGAVHPRFTQRELSFVLQLIPQLLKT